MSSVNFNDDGSDCELELLPFGNMAQTFGNHELRTAPLVSRDAVALCGNFAQRGFMGSVFSVHAEDLPSTTADSRVYMNLDAPSSGLVCGVQVCLAFNFLRLASCFASRDLARATQSHV
jgi:hypothetical protein